MVGQVKHIHISSSSGVVFGWVVFNSMEEKVHFHLLLMPKSHRQERIVIISLKMYGVSLTVKDFVETVG